MKSKMSKSELYLTSSKEEQQLYDDVRYILETARNSAYKSVNSIMSKSLLGDRRKNCATGAEWN